LDSGIPVVEVQDWIGVAFWATLGIAFITLALEK
jgi:hypothetical protein